jgi:hydroxymethylbilane synthase
LLSALRAGCLAPVGAWARVADGRLELDAVVLSHDGRHRISVSQAGPWEQAESLGTQAAADLLEQGAEQLIVASRQPA